MRLEFISKTRVAARSLERRRGFTLVEMLIVLSIIGLAGAVIVPQIMNTGSLTIQAASRAVMADVIYAQNQAIAKQRVRRVVFDVANNRYNLTDSAGTTLGVSWKEGGGNVENYVTDFGGDERFRGVHLVAVNFNGDSIIEYDAMGSPTYGGTIDLASGDNQYRITITALTGRVSIAVLP